MGKTQLEAFLEKATTDEKLRSAFIDFAAQHGFTIGDDELGEADLDAIAGGKAYVPRKLDPYPDR